MTVTPDGEVKVYYHGAVVKKDVFEGSEYFTDSAKEASAYAEMKALEAAVEENEELSEIVYDVLAEEGGDSITDLDVSIIHDIIEANGIVIEGGIGMGVVSEATLDFKNPADLTKFGSEVGSADYVGKTWNELHEAGLIDESWESLDEDVQQELQDKYADKAIYKLFEEEGVFKKAFEQGHDAIIFTDQGLGGKTTHNSYLVADKAQIKPVSKPTPPPSQFPPQVRPSKRGRGKP